MKDREKILIQHELEALAENLEIDYFGMADLADVWSHIANKY
jgi:hypothetical protein